MMYICLSFFLWEAEPKAKTWAQDFHLTSGPWNPEGGSRKRERERRKGKASISIRVFPQANKACPDRTLCKVYKMLPDLPTCKKGDRHIFPWLLAPLVESCNYRC